MEVTKYEQACLLISQNGSRLLIDPGGYTNLPADLKNIATIVITHEHSDHFDIPNLRLVLKQSPQAKIFSTGHVAEALAKEGIDCRAVEGQMTASSGGFELEFREVDHSIIYQTPPCRNLSVGVGDFLYYPGDSFVDSGRQYELLALPASGPWFNMAEAIDLAKGCRVRHIFATHEVHASETGCDSFYKWVGMHIGDDKEMVRLAVGQSFSL